MIELRGISLAFGPRKLFNNISGVINRRDKIGLAGPNGAGKSTLLKMLAGEIDQDAGEIVKPKYVSFGYLTQDISELSENTLYKEAESAFENVIALRNDLAFAEDFLQTLDTASDSYLQTLEDISSIEHKLEHLEESRLRSKIETVLHGLGFSQNDMDRPCSEFSGGWKMRIALAKLLLREPSLLMLDEPTNHLDIESITWLEEYLQNYEGAVIVVSHDKAFLNLLTKTTFYLGAGKLDIYAGNYDYFERESVARKERLVKAAQNQAKAIEKTERFIERFRAKNTKAAQVQSRIKALDKIERIEIDQELSGIKFRFPEPKRSGQVVISVKNISKSYGDKLVLNDINLEVQRGEHIAIVGANGAGKTTLARIMADRLEKNSGSVELGYNVEMSYFAQHQAEELNKENTVLEEAESAAPMGEKQKARGLIGAFLFSGDDAFKKVSVLSGGEKNRLALAKMLLQSFNFLILDEPTNHLDINSKKVLQDALKTYEGTFVIVSHDRDFLDPIISKVVEIGKKGVRSFLGNISDYVEKIRAEGAFENPSTKSKISSSALTHKEQKLLKSEKNKLIGKLKREIENAEKEIARLDLALADLEGEMSDENFFKDSIKSAEALKNHARLKAESEKFYETWSQLSDELTKISDD